MDDVLVLGITHSRFRSLSGTLKDFGSLGVLGCGEVCGRRDMELRTSVSSVFSARSDFVVHFPRFYLTQSFGGAFLLMHWNGC
jgi:hypothetical protein